MSKTSTPSNLPKYSNLSKPVAWSKSVGMVPALAPGPINESGPVTSAKVSAVLDSTLAWAKNLVVVNNLDCLAARVNVRESLFVSIALVVELELELDVGADLNGWAKCN